MDEPFSSLDALTRESAQEVFLDLWESFRPTAVIVTHSIEEAAVTGGKILVLSRRPGTAAAFLDNPAFGAEKPRESAEFRRVARLVRDIVGSQWAGEH